MTVTVDLGFGDVKLDGQAGGGRRETSSGNFHNKTQNWVLHFCVLDF